MSFLFICRIIFTLNQRHAHDIQSQNSSLEPSNVPQNLFEHLKLRNYLNSYLLFAHLFTIDPIMSSSKSGKIISVNIWLKKCSCKGHFGLIYVHWILFIYMLRCSLKKWNKINRLAGGKFLLNICFKVFQYFDAIWSIGVSLYWMKSWISYEHWRLVVSSDPGWPTMNKLQILGNQSFPQDF